MHLESYTLLICNTIWKNKIKENLCMFLKHPKPLILELQAVHLPIFYCIKINHLE